MGPQPADQGRTQGCGQQGHFPFLQGADLLEALQESAQPRFVRMPAAGAHQGFHPGEDQQPAVPLLPQVPGAAQLPAAPGSVPAKHIAVVPQPFQRRRPGKARSFTEGFQLRLGLPQLRRCFSAACPARARHQPGGVLPIAGQRIRFDPEFQFVILHSLLMFPRLPPNIPDEFPDEIADSS